SRGPCNGRRRMTKERGPARAPAAPPGDSARAPWAKGGLPDPRGQVLAVPPVLPCGDMNIDETAARQYVQRVWDESVIPTLTEYVRIPAKSPHFDPQWKEHGHIDRAVSLLQEWSDKRPIEGLRLEVVQLEGRTPVMLMDVPGASSDTVLLYGHCDKQPEMVGW